MYALAYDGRSLRPSRPLPRTRPLTDGAVNLMDANSPESSLTSAPQLRFGKIDDLASRVAASIDAARKYLFSQQHEDGYWCGELEADTTLESDYILLHMLLGTGSQERFQKAANHILRHQNEDCGMSIFDDRPPNISAFVQTHFR